MSEPAPRRSRWPFFAAVAGLLALLPLAFWIFLREPPPPPPAPPGPDASAPEAPDASLAAEALHLAEISGSVEIRHGAGEYGPAQLGTVLQADDALRTVDGRARLVARDAYDVQVEPGTELEVQALAERLSRFRLGQGMVVARVEGKAGQRLEVSAKDSDAVAASQGGSFAVSSNGAGTVAVGAREGEVQLTAAGKAVVLRGGQQSLVTPGHAPTPAAPIPASLFLKVAWPAEKETNRSQVAVTGRTDPGAILLVAGTPARVEKDGRFKVSVRLREGKNGLVATGLDVGDHRVESRSEIRVDTTAPDSNISTQKLWNP